MGYRREFLELSQTFDGIAQALESKARTALPADSAVVKAKEQETWRHVARVEALVADACRHGGLPGFEERLISYVASIPSRYYVMLGIDLSPLMQDGSEVTKCASPLATEGFSRIRLWLKVAGGPVFSSTGKGYLASIPGVFGQLFEQRMPNLPHEGKEVCLSDVAARRDFWSGVWVTRRWAKACELLGELSLEDGS